VSRLPVLSGEQVIKALERAGLVHVRTRGSHAILRNPTTGHGVTVPLHETIKRGTLSAILRQIGMDADEFASLL
jgi:predicted RNA binding protein YcfA (HicA-like mRNA interferase family)